MNRNVLITGGAGFIGSHLAPKLIKEGYAVTILDNLSPQVHSDPSNPPEWIGKEGCRFIKGSVTDRLCLEEALSGVGCIVHLAAETGTGQSMYDIERYTEVNTQGTALLLDIIANKDNEVQKFLLASSRSVYGEGAYHCLSCSDSVRVNPPSRLRADLENEIWNPVCSRCGSQMTELPTKETDGILPSSIYAVTKFSQEQLVEVACESMGLDYAMFRLQNVYGEGQSLINPYTGILSIFSTKIRLGKVLPVFEDGNETRDFVHVEDVVNVFVAAAKTDKPICDVMNVGTGVGASILEMAQYLSDAFGVAPNTEITKQFRIGDIRHNRADVSKLEEKLDYRPTIGIEEGLKRFASWVSREPLPGDLVDEANNELKRRNLLG